MFKKAELEIYKIDLSKDIIVTSDPTLNDDMDPDVVWPF